MHIRATIRARLARPFSVVILTEATRAEPLMKAVSVAVVAAARSFGNASTDVLSPLKLLLT